MNADDPRHGTYAGYVRGCRCDPCRKANATYTKARRNANRGKQPHKHGQANGYIDYRCNCNPCMAAHLRAQAAIYLRQAERLEREEAQARG